MVNPAKYVEVADNLATLIRAELSPGDLVPTSSELAERFNVHRNTMGKAIQLLKEQGLLSGKPGGKTWVRVPPVQTVRRNTRYQEEKNLVLQPEEERRRQGVAEMDSGISLASVYEDIAQHDVVECPPDVAKDLELEPGTLALRRTRTRRHRKDGGVGQSVSYIPYDLANRNPELLDSSRDPWPGGTMHQLHTLGIEVGSIEDRITASAPTEDEISAFDIPPGVPILRICKRTFSTTGRVVEVAYIPQPADRATLIYHTPLEPWS